MANFKRGDMQTDGKRTDKQEKSTAMLASPPSLKNKVTLFSLGTNLIDTGTITVNKMIFALNLGVKQLF